MHGPSNTSSQIIENLLGNIQENIEHNGEEVTDWKPKLEMEFKTEESAHKFYNEYARQTGFSIRREYGNKSKKDGVLTSINFTCNKEGVRGPDKRDYATKEARAETRTQCPAKMVISLNRKVGMYKVVHFVAKHNHPLQPLKYVHMLTSHRHITESQASQIDMASESGLRVKDAHEFMTKQAGGIDSLAFTRRDLKNYLRTKRKNSLRFGEVGALFMYFKNQQNEDPSFFYDFQMDVEEQITNIFWADTQMVNDYRSFGDVITFDTTYKTNKDYRPLGVFIGYNNHRQTVVFGATLLYDETIPSFTWLFETFLKAMEGKKPKTILTDQDAAMSNAISLVMQDTFHGLCTWHIRENALRHMNHLYQKGSEFAKDFEACIDLYETEEELIDAWNYLIIKYEIPNDSWLHYIFKVKKKWAWAYVRTTFTAGMRSTQLSESFNADLKRHLKSDLNLMEFFTQFERVLNGKRYNESEAEKDSIHKLPMLKMKKAPMLVQASNVYTPYIFKEFQEEYEEFQGAYVTEHIEDQSKHAYRIANVNNTKDRIVLVDFVQNMVSCDCCKFQTHGILCSHAIKVLDIMNIKLIPQHYILKRWTRDARQENDLGGSRHHFSKRYRELCPRVIKLVNRACESRETHIFMSKVYEECTKIVEEMLKKMSLEKESSKGCNVSILISNEQEQSSKEENEQTQEKTKQVDEIVAKGIKKKECSHKGKRRPKTWLEKAKKRNAPNTKSKTGEQKSWEASVQHTTTPLYQNALNVCNVPTFSQMLRGAPLDQSHTITPLYENALNVCNFPTFTQMLTGCPLDQLHTASQQHKNGLNLHNVSTFSQGQMFTRNQLHTSTPNGLNVSNVPTFPQMLSGNPHELHTTTPPPHQNASNSSNIPNFTEMLTAQLESIDDLNFSLGL